MRGDGYGTSRANNFEGMGAMAGMGSMGMGAMGGMGGMGGMGMMPIGYGMGESP